MTLPKGIKYTNTDNKKNAAQVLKKIYKNIWYIIESTKAQKCSKIQHTTLSLSQPLVKICLPVLLQVPYRPECKRHKLKVRLCDEQNTKHFTNQIKRIQKNISHKPEHKNQMPQPHKFIYLPQGDDADSQ